MHVKNTHDHRKRDAWCGIQILKLLKSPFERLHNIKGTGERLPSVKTVNLKKNAFECFPFHGGSKN